MTFLQPILVVFIDIQMSTNGIAVHHYSIIFNTKYDRIETHFSISKAYYAKTVSLAQSLLAAGATARHCLLGAARTADAARDDALLTISLHAHLLGPAAQLLDRHLLQRNAAGLDRAGRQVDHRLKLTGRQIHNDRLSSTGTEGQTLGRAAAASRARALLSAADVAQDTSIAAGTLDARPLGTLEELLAGAKLLGHGATLELATLQTGNNIKDRIHFFLFYGVVWGGMSIKVSLKT